MVRKLILVKHARPRVDPRVPSDQWELGEEGRRACAPLAAALKEFAPLTLVSSLEPKALQTAEEIGRELSIPARSAPDLHEHDRSNVPHMDTREFIASMALMFQQPGRLILGRETAQQALGRFEKAIDSLLAEQQGNLAVVSHGTVIALLAQARASQDSFTLWRQMGQPSLIVLDAQTWKVLDLRAKIS